MRIVAYNILDGGRDRVDALAQVLEAQRPDVVGLVEADHEDVVAAIAGRLGMHHAHAPGISHGSALLTRHEIVEHHDRAREHPELSRSLLEARVSTPVGTELVFGVLHLHPHAREADERRREGELALILGLFAEHRRLGQPHVLLGDFNANAPQQQIDPARCKPRTQREWEANGGYVPRRVIETVREAGYLDAVRQGLGPDADRTGSFTTEYPGQRVDYVFTFGIPPEAITAGWIHQRDPAAEASDHFPVGIEIDAHLGA